MDVIERTIYVCPEGCGWWEGDAHGIRPSPHGCRLVKTGEVVEMVPVTVTDDRGAVGALCEIEEKAARRAEFLADAISATWVRDKARAGLGGQSVEPIEVRVDLETVARAAKDWQEIATDAPCGNVIFGRRCDQPHGHEGACAEPPPALDEKSNNGDRHDD